MEQKSYLNSGKTHKTLKWQAEWWWVRAPYVLMWGLLFFLLMPGTMGCFFLIYFWKLLSSQFFWNPKYLKHCYLLYKVAVCHYTDGASESYWSSWYHIHRTRAGVSKTTCDGFCEARQCCSSSYNITADVHCAFCLLLHQLLGIKQLENRNPACPTPCHQHQASSLF